MNKYRKIPQAVIDLHGLTVTEATEQLQRLLADKKYHHVRIITGKGNHSTGGVPVLREMTKQFLARHNIRFTQSKITDGGEGSVEVFFDN